MLSLLHGLVAAVFMTLAGAHGGAHTDALSASVLAGSAGLTVPRASISSDLQHARDLPASITLAVELPEALDGEAEAEEEDPAGDGYALLRPAPKQLPVACEASRFVRPMFHWGSWHLPSGHPRAPPAA